MESIKITFEKRKSDHPCRSLLSSESIARNAADSRLWLVIAKRCPNVRLIETRSVNVVSIRFRKWWFLLFCDYNFCDRVVNKKRFMHWLAHNQKHANYFYRFHTDKLKNSSKFSNFHKKKFPESSPSSPHGWVTIEVPNPTLLGLWRCSETTETTRKWTNWIPRTDSKRWENNFFYS